MRPGYRRQQGRGQGHRAGTGAAGRPVAVNYCTGAAGAEAAAAEIRGAGGRALIVRADVSSKQQADAMFDRVLAESGRLHILVNNAGIQTWKPLLKLTEEEWDRVLDVNLKGTFLCTQRAARVMKDTGGGAIVNIGSGCNKWPFPNLVSYTASKGGVEQFTKVAAVELGRRRIRVNCVAPGAIEIERTRQEAGDYAGTWSKLTPLGRIGLPSDVAAAVAFLREDGAEFITGQEVRVDGGLFTRPVWPCD